MHITASQLQTHYQMLLEALKRGEEVVITDHGQRIGVIHPEPSVAGSAEKEVAMKAFSQSNASIWPDRPEDIDGVVDDMRQGRRKQLDAL